MPKLIILYGPPSDPAAFEDYYARRHIPYASEHMQGVTGACEPASPPRTAKS